MLEVILGAAGVVGSTIITVWTRNAHLEKRMELGFESVKDGICRTNLEAQIREERIEGRLDLHEYRIDRLEQGAKRNDTEDENTDESLS